MRPTRLTKRVLAIALSATLFAAGGISAFAGAEETVTTQPAVEPITFTVTEDQGGNDGATENGTGVVVYEDEDQSVAVTGVNAVQLTEDGENVPVDPESVLAMMRSSTSEEEESVVEEESVAEEESVDPGADLEWKVTHSKAVEEQNDGTYLLTITLEALSRKKGDENNVQKVDIVYVVDESNSMNWVNDPNEEKPHK